MAVIAGPYCGTDDPTPDFCPANRHCAELAQVTFADVRAEDVPALREMFALPVSAILDPGAENNYIPLAIAREYMERLSSVQFKPVYEHRPIEAVMLGQRIQERPLMLDLVLLDANGKPVCTLKAPCNGGFVPINFDKVVLGRKALSHGILTLDGPNANFSLAL